MIETMSGGGRRDNEDTLRREVLALRARVADLQRAAARHEDTAGISLAEREELLSEAERITHLGTWTWDIPSGRVFWSDEMYRILGYEARSVVPSVEAFFERIHPEDRTRAYRATLDGQENGVLPLLDCRLVRPDGSVRQTAVQGSYLFDKDGTPQRMVGGVLDRTQSLQVETRLRSTLALLEESQRLAQLGSWRFDPATGALEWSREFGKIAGFTADEPASVSRFLERIVAEDRGRFEEEYRQALDSPRAVAVDGRLERPDGKIRHVRVRGALVPGAGDQVELRGTMQDVSDQVRWREELAHSQKMEAVGRLAGGIAHDFNNLLTVVVGNLDLLSDRIGEAPELLDSLRALDSASNLTRRLLAFGRKAQLSLVDSAPNEIVSSTLSLLRRLVGDRARLETDLAPGLPHIRVDPLELERALVNLVVNARDVMPGGGRVVIRTRETIEGEARWVEIAVEDEGPGIDETIRDHLFEPFYTTRGGTGGTGLGLATVLGTAEQHGGTVRVESGEDKGSTFTIVLPAVDPSSQRSGSTLLPRSGERVVRALHLLVIDDEPLVAKVTRRMLASRGHVVYSATRPVEARAIWKEHGETIDLVVCDVSMPDVRGPDLIQSMFADGQSARVVFMSGYNEEASVVELGFETLRKPFSVTALEQAIVQSMSMSLARKPIEFDLSQH